MKEHYFGEFVPSKCYFCKFTELENYCNSTTKILSLSFQTQAKYVICTLNEKKFLTQEKTKLIAFKSLFVCNVNLTFFKN